VSQPFIIVFAWKMTVCTKFGKKPGAAALPYKPFFGLPPALHGAAAPPPVPMINMPMGTFLVVPMGFSYAATPAMESNLSIFN
jgi:hypothetical protein